MKIMATSTPIWDGKAAHAPGEPFEMADADARRLIDAGHACAVKVVTKEVAVPTNEPPAKREIPLGRLPCPHCDRHYANEETLGVHIKTAHPEMLPPDGEGSEGDGKTPPEE